MNTIEDKCLWLDNMGMCITPVLMEELVDLEQLQEEYTQHCEMHEDYPTHTDVVWWDKYYKLSSDISQHERTIGMLVQHSLRLTIEERLAKVLEDWRKEQ